MVQSLLKNRIRVENESLRLSRREVATKARRNSRIHFRIPLIKSKDDQMYSFSFDAEIKEREFFYE